MPAPVRTRDAASIVLVGAFAPGVFTPAWLAAKGLIQEVEAEVDDAAKAQLILSSDLAQFRVNWLSMQVLPGRFLASAQTPDNFPLLGDLVQSILSYFPELPIRQMGLNRDIRFTIQSADEWHAVGHSLAPKALWKAHMKEPGMLSLTMHGKRPDERPGHIQVTVRPTRFVPPYEVDVAYNDHIDLPADATGEAAIKDIASEWDVMLGAADKLATDLISNAIKVPAQ